MIKYKASHPKMPPKLKNYLHHLAEHNAHINKKGL